MKIDSPPALNDIAAQPLFREEVLVSRRMRLHGEVVLSQSISAEFIVLGILAIIAGTLVWLSLASYARTEPSRGVLVTTAASTEVFAPQAGIIKELSVTEGQRVRKGQLLGIVEMDRRTGEGTSLATGGAQIVERQISLSKQRMLIMAQHGVQERQRLTSAIATTQARMVPLRSQIALQAELVNSSKQFFDKLAPVMANGFISQSEFERRKQSWLVAQQQLDGLHQQMRILEGDQVAAQFAIDALPTDTAGQMNDVESAVEALNRQKLDLGATRSYALVAPTSGQVTILQAGAGRAARANTPLMTIVPLNARLQAEAYVPSRAIGFVAPGQEVRLLYDAFPYQRFGSAVGRVVSISSSVLTPQDFVGPFKIEEPVYKVVIALGDQSVNGYGRTLALHPGMTLTANLILERSSFIDWLLMPVRAVTNRQ